MRIDRPAASLPLAAVLVAALAAPAPAAEFTQVASHMLTMKDNASCYLSNLGAAAVRVKALKFVTFDGAELPPQANSCGTGTFSLAPGTVCFIGVNQPPSLLFCSALVSDARAVRGALESRLAERSEVVDRARLTTGSGGTSSTDFQIFASPAASGQRPAHSASCLITNVGAAPARLKDREITTSSGVALSVTDTCGPRPEEIVLKPGKTCFFSAPLNESHPDAQCRLLATRKANLRGAQFPAPATPPAEME